MPNPYEESNGEIHLLECENVSLEARQDKFGVKYKDNDGDEGWTPVEFVISSGRIKYLEL